MDNSTGLNVTANDLDIANDEMAVILQPVIAIVCIYMVHYNAHITLYSCWKKLCHLKRFRFATTTQKPSKNIETPPTSSSEVNSHSGRFKHDMKPTQNSIQLLQISKAKDANYNTSVYNEGKRQTNVSSLKSTQNSINNTPLLREKDNTIISTLSSTCAKVENSRNNLQPKKLNIVPDFTDSDSDTKNSKYESRNIRQRSLVHRKRKFAISIYI
ncbi:unnamed protein product [Mytilus edulis]|uniref:Uncharacterized protein n=1 Tax=Mytilus edulis TaxID=6550 RepID=A0A8S3PWY1_MYTED|nr:unnamed protein product [Mytilus edulis]